MASPHEKADTAATTTTELAGNKSPAKITTTNLDPSQAASTTPSQSLDLRRPSDISTPATAHNDGLNPFDTDLEAMVSSRTLTAGDDSCGMKSTTNVNVKGNSPDCQVWPGKDHWKRKAKTARVNRHSCQMLAKMSKRNRIIAKICIIALILAVAVAVGLGVSKSLGAAIWSPKDN